MGATSSCKAGAPCDPSPRLALALLAISLGTMIEWFDFTIYTQMSKVLGKVFFPVKSPGLQALSFYGVQAVGYISRPAGAVLFGHLGDTKGRGICLLLSVLLMGIPTVLIGCLPTYNHIGIAAPILLALMRLVQGLAMGGEFGAAMVYLHEIADPRYKSLTGALGYTSLGVGVIVGLLVVIAVNEIPPAALEVWGWRVPFLLASITLAVAVVLRYNMLESAEFTASREQLDDLYHSRLKQRGRATRKASLKALLTTNPKTKPVAGAADACAGGDLESRSTGTAASLGPDFACEVKDVDCRGSDACAATAAGAAAVDVESQQAAAVLKERHYVPLVELVRGYWLGLLLQMGYGAWIGASFYLGYSWLPSFFVQYVGFDTKLTLWMVLSCMVLVTLVVPFAGLMSDRGQPRLTATIIIYAIAAGTSVPLFLAFQTKNLAVCWVLQAVSLVMSAYTMGLLPAICSSIYPAAVRISGFSIGYMCGMTWFAGMTPLILSAIQASTGSIFVGPGLYMTGCAVLSIVCSVLLMKHYPQTNRF